MKVAFHLADFDADSYWKSQKKKSGHIYFIICMAKLLTHISLLYIPFFFNLNFKYFSFVVAATFIDILILFADLIDEHGAEFTLCNRQVKLQFA